MQSIVIKGLIFTQKVLQECSNKYDSTKKTNFGYTFKEILTFRSGNHNSISRQQSALHSACTSHVKLKRRSDAKWYYLLSEAIAPMLSLRFVIIVSCFGCWDASVIMFTKSDHLFSTQSHEEATSKTAACHRNKRAEIWNRMKARHLNYGPSVYGGHVLFCIIAHRIKGHAIPAIA